ncbi:MAG: diguanylate cyclase [Acidobacteria bacterium]|nr:diguanylate cyclase [Acidobacteriota bacterium]
MKKPILAALALVFSLPLLSQVLPFEILGLKEGIPQSQVSALAQDREGYLWVGTWGGLARFNGSEFRNFFREDGLHSTRIQELLVASDATLWIATVAGVSRWRDHRLEMLKEPAVTSVRCRALAEDARRRIWVGTDNGVVVIAGETATLLHPGGGKDGPVVQDILFDREGILVAADNGLWRYSGDALQQPAAVAGPGTVAPDSYRALAVTAEGLWLGTTDTGAWLRNDKGWRNWAEGPGAPRSIYRMAVEPSGILYIATSDNGLFRKHPGSAVLEHWGPENGLPSKVVSAVLEDRENNVWVGTDIGGLARLSGMAVINHTEKQGLPSACVFGITPGDHPDSLWLGTMRGAVHYQVRPVPRVLESLRAEDGLGNEWVWKVLRTDDGTLWFMTDSALLFRRPGESAVRSLPAEVPFPRTVPYEMVIDGQGNLWGCGEWSGGGLARRDRQGRWRGWKTTPAGEPLTIVTRLTPRRQGGVWLMSRGVIYQCDGEALSRLDAPCPLAGSVNISSIFEDSRGRLWAGSDAGLAVLETTGAWRLLNDSPGFTNHHVFFIGEDWKGTIWVNTARGAFRFLADYKVEAFTPDDGLADWETNAYGFFSDARGEIWIGTVNGLSQYNPAGRTPNTEPPRLMVESARLPKRLLEFPRSLDLPWKERSLAFQIAVLSYRGRNRAAYRYRMEGMESEWQKDEIISRELRYTNLPAGDLNLLLQPVNESGVWGEVVTLPIRVHPPFWMTLWFRLGGLLFLLAVAVGVYRWRTLLLRRRNRELESEVSKRTAELEYLATYDPLTSLLNRRAVLAFMEKQLRPERGSNRQLGCIMVDLNRFKQVNDTLGHAAGDQVLKDMAARIQECLRQGDALGRLGGDEFLVVLPGADMEALRSVERRISGLACQAGEGAAAVMVSAACGAVALPAGSIAAAAAVLARADDLLYQVKRGGRRGAAVEAFTTPSG